jgi:SAM-dependent methyltransferase
MAGFYHAVFDRLPEALRRRINPLDFAIRDFVCSQSLRTGVVVLDAGAGESQFRGCFGEQFYIALDATVGDPEWDYSGIDLCADLGGIPLRSSSVDLVLNTQVLEHVENPGVVLREIRRVLKDGGSLLLTAPQGWPEHQQPNDFYRFTRFALSSLMKEAGFSESHVEPIGGYFHYLGHRLTFIPKVLFQDRQGLLRVLLFPLELVCLAFFCAFCPFVCYYLDALDKKKEFTLCYRVLAVK